MLSEADNDHNKTKNVEKASTRTSAKLVEDTVHVLTQRLFIMQSKPSRELDAIFKAYGDRGTPLTVTVLPFYALYLRRSLLRIT